MYDLVTFKGKVVKDIQTIEGSIEQVLDVLKIEGHQISDELVLIVFNLEGRWVASLSEGVLSINK
jgi:repressor of nif and glnA expression